MIEPVVELTEAQALSLEGEECAPGQPFNVEENKDGTKWVSLEELDLYFEKEDTKKLLWLLRCPQIEHDPILFNDEGIRIN